MNVYKKTVFVFSLLAPCFSADAMNMPEEHFDNDGDCVLVDRNYHFIRAYENYHHFRVRLDLVTGHFEFTIPGESLTAWGDGSQTYPFPDRDVDPTLARLKSKIEQTRDTINVDDLPPLDPFLLAQRELIQSVLNGRQKECRAKYRLILSADQYERIFGKDKD